MVKLLYWCSISTSLFSIVLLPLRKSVRVRVRVRVRFTVWVWV